jgi:peptide/nickel transport system substrate-binding protein
MRSGFTALAGLMLIAAFGAAGPAAQAQAQDRETVRVSFPSEDGSLTPYTFTTGYPLVMLVYDSLTWRDAGGVPRPWLASSGRRDAAGRTVTVRLRRGVRWHDGRPLTADDVVFTYRFMAERAHPRFTPQLRDIAAVTATDARTVVFSLRRPSLGFEDQPLADVPILPRHLWEGLPAGQAAPRGLPIGSGPYRLVRHVVDGRYSFRANRGYFHGAPSVDTLQVPIVGREASAFAQLKRGSLDAAPVNLPAGAAIERSGSVRFAEGVSFNGTMLEFNVARAPFDRLAARRAVSQALRLTAIAGNKNGPGAMAPAERGMLHPQSRWAPATTLHRSDVTAARLAFAERAVAPFAILASRNDGVRLEAARRVVAALRREGAPVRLQVLSARQFERRLGRDGSGADFDAAVVGIPALASYDPAYLRNVFGDPQSATLNDGDYRGTAFAPAADRVDAATTRAAREAAVAGELKVLATDLPAVPLFFGGTTFAYRTRGYAGWVDVTGSGILDKQSFIDAASTAADGSPSPPASDPRDTTDEGDAFSLVPVIIGVAVLLLLGGAWAALRGRNANSPRRPRGR